jgi:hypothetical protein
MVFSHRTFRALRPPPVAGMKPPPDGIIGVRLHELG